MNYEKEFGEIGKKKVYTPENSKWFYLPTMGAAPITITVEKIEKKIPKDPKFCFIRKEKIKLPDGSDAEKTVNLGYQIEVTCSDGRILSVSSLGAFLNVFVKPDVQEGDTITIEHVDKGVWKVEKKGAEIDLDEPPVDETQAEELFDDSHLTAEGKKWAKK